MKKIMFINFILIVLALSAPSLVFAQVVNVRGGFIQDSLRIGDEIPFYLTATYPVEDQILFPDSSFNFSPFEYKRKEYFTTSSNNSTSYDSVVYFLTTFEIDRRQKLALPIFRLSERDCTKVMSAFDSVLVQQLVPVLPDSLSDLPVRATIAYQKVQAEFNFPLVVMIVAVLVLMVAVIYFVFGEQIRRRLRRKRMIKAHAAFVAAFDRHLKEKNISGEDTEAALKIWKSYMEKLNARPYTKLTTRETIRLEKDERLGESLRSIDAAIYGHGTPKYDSLVTLKGFADQRFQMKIREVTHG